MSSPAVEWESLKNGGEAILKWIRRAAFAALLLPLVPAAAESPSLIEGFSPQGTVKGVRQATARFSESMVSFGDPRLSEPFDVDCAEKGRGRWVDDRNWAYDFDRDLPAGVTCGFRVKPGLKSLAGAEVPAAEFRFSTGGPGVVRSVPYEGSQGIDEEQVFVLTLDAPATETSIAENVRCEIEGIGEQVGVRLIRGGERLRILEAAQDRSGRVLVKSRRGLRIAKIVGEKSPGELRVVLQCARRFPNDSEVTLVWGKGVAAASGVATDTDQRLPFRVRKAFTARFSCQRVNPQAKCVPVTPMRLGFNAPVAWSLASAIRLEESEGRSFRPVKGEDSKEGYVYGVTFEGPFREMARFRITLPKNLRDDAGRRLVNAGSFPLQVETDPYPPLAKFPARFGIVELNAGALLPVTLRGVEAKVAAREIEVSADGKAIPGKMRRLGPGEDESIMGWYRRLRDDEEYGMRGDARVSHTHETPMLRDEKDARAFKVPRAYGGRTAEVIGIPFKRPGFYVVELASPRLGAALIGRNTPYYVRTGALVTNLAAHFLEGREGSLIWVTSLDQGEPVEGSRVAVHDCKGDLLWQGVTDARGVARIQETLPTPPCPYPDHHYFVSARKGEDMTFVFSDWQKGIEKFRFNLPGAQHREQALAHTVFDRALFRAGETVAMKHFIRRHSQSGFLLLKEDDLPKWAVIFHPGSRQRYVLPLKWDARGVAESTWAIPKEAKLGAYEVYLQRAEPPAQQENADQQAARDYFRPDGWRSGQFRVEQFRLPSMRALIQPPAGPLVNASSVELDLYLGYLSGGGAGNAPVVLRSQVQPRTVQFPDYEGFAFAAGDVKEGTERRSSSSLAEEDELPYDEVWEPVPEGAEPAGKGKVPRAQNLTLDKAGALRASIGNLPRSTTPQDLVAELEYRDANGEVQTVSRRVPLWPSAVVLGIKPDSWAASKEAFRFQVLALDSAGKPQADVPVQVDLFSRTRYSHRKRLIGGFYAYEHVTQVKRLAALCEGRTDARGLLHCDARSPVSGNVIVRARAADPAGNPSFTQEDVWIAGKGEWWFDVADHDRIDLLPEKKRYEPGETARLQVRMPFRNATALVTVQREGVMETSVQRLSGTQPTIEVPVLDHYAPNVFVSVLVVRGRVEGVKPTALVDLGRPAFKLGIAAIRVGWAAHELKVNLAGERSVFKVREKARLRVSVRRANGSAPPAGSEVALAAVDEALLELKPNESWQLLEAMMRPRGLEVETATNQMQVTGKRHFGRKAVPQGGDGAFSAAKGGTRELFDTLLAWKVRVALDENGDATVEVPINDSLTSFRIVAVAHGGVGLFGTGQTTIRSTQDLQLLSGLPQLVREGDRYRALFTARNGSGRALKVTVNAALATSPDGRRFLPAESGKLAPAMVTLEAGEAREIGWDVSVPPDVVALEWQVSAEADGGAEDRLRLRQKVAAAVPVQVYQATLEQLDRRRELPVERPADALPKRGGVNVSLRPSLVGGLDGVRYYMSRYPYTCIEQRASKAIALRDAGLWKEVIAALPSHMDSDGLVKYFPLMRWGSEVLTAYLLSVSQEAGWDVPDDLRRHMESGLTRFVQGKLTRYYELPTADLSIRKMMAVEALSRYGKADAALLDSITLNPNLWPTSAVLDYQNVLNRVPGIPDRDGKHLETEQILRSRLNFQGTTMGFSTDRSDALWWLMISADVNAVRAILNLLEDETWQKDLPRMARGALGRQYRGHWTTTTANAWGVLAMEKFAAKFEAVPVKGATQATLESQSKRLDWGKQPEGGTLALEWPREKAMVAAIHEGEGKPWVTFQSLAAIPLKEPYSSGYRIRKTLTPVLQKDGTRWSRGDVVRVRLDIEAQADMTWVVVSDPVPASATILGGGLARDSQLLTQDEKRKGWVWPAFEERSFEAYRAYFEYVPKGSFTVEYSLRLNNEGAFELPATRVEALYSPEMLGEAPNARFVVAP